MHGTRIAVVVGLAVAALALVGCAGDDGDGAATETDTATETSTPSASTVLAGSVGPGFEIRLSTDGEPPNTNLAAGSYTIEVDDLSEIHNFHLAGPGVDEKTEVEATGTTRWAVELQDGTYTFVCDPHETTMKGSFEVSGS